jgi:hypothetical protein
MNQWNSPGIQTVHIPYLQPSTVDKGRQSVVGGDIEIVSIRQGGLQDGHCQLDHVALCIAAELPLPLHCHTALVS